MNVMRLARYAEKGPFLLNINSPGRIRDCLARNGISSTVTVFSGKGILSARRLDGNDFSGSDTDVLARTPRSSGFALRR
jgi:hypothetical protein